MFNESMRGISVLSYSLLNSVNDIIASNTHTQISEDKCQFVSSEGDIYFPMSAKIKHGGDGEKAIPTFMIDGDDTDSHLRSFNWFRDNYVADGITTISYNKSVFLPTLLKRLAKDEKTYGVLIQKDSYMINPLHPMIAFSVTSGLLELPEEGELHIFEWKTSVARDIERENIRSHETRKNFYTDEYQKTFGLFKYLIKEAVVEKRTAFLSDDGVNKIVNDPLLDDININIQVDVSSEADRGSDNIKSVIIPMQVAIGNMATPYYGMMLLQKPRGDIVGYNLTPMMSGNLNQGMCEVSSYGDLAEHTSSGNVCTGSESSTSPRGWSTLSKINLNSMFNDELVSETGLVSFVEASKNISGVIWEGIEKESLAALETAEEAVAEAEPEQRRSIVVEEA